LAAAIDDYPHRFNDRAMCLNNIDRLLNTSSACDDVFGNDVTLTILDFKTAAQNQSAAGFFLNENVPFPQRAADLLTDNDLAEGRGNHRVTSEAL
jgi:hypothetical protein